jgi:hypothetical protein
MRRSGCGVLIMKSRVQNSEFRSQKKSRIQEPRARIQNKRKSEECGFSLIILASEF